MLDWKDNDKQCSLTSLEAKLRGTWTPGNSDDENAPEFFRPLINKIIKPFFFGKEIKSRETAGQINNILFLSILLYNIVRFIHIQGVSFAPETEKSRYYMYLTLLLPYYISPIDFIPFRINENKFKISIFYFTRFEYRGFTIQNLTFSILFTFIIFFTKMCKDYGIKLKKFLKSIGLLTP